AAMFAMPAVRHAASAWSRNSTGVGPQSAPTSTAGWSESYVKSYLWRCSPPAPENGAILLWLCVPEIHLLTARNLNCASSGCWPTAWIVASSVGVSTPLRGVFGVRGLEVDGVVGVWVEVVIVGLVPL